MCVSVSSLFRNQGDGPCATGSRPLRRRRERFAAWFASRIYLLEGWCWGDVGPSGLVLSWSLLPWHSCDHVLCVCVCVCVCARALFVCVCPGRNAVAGFVSQCHLLCRVFLIRLRIEMFSLFILYVCSREECSKVTSHRKCDRVCGMPPMPACDVMMDKWRQVGNWLEELCQLGMTNAHLKPSGRRLTWKAETNSATVLHPSHNIRDFNFLLAAFDHSSYLNFFCKYKKQKVMLKVL